MVKKLKYKNIAWLDVASPTGEEVAKLTMDYQLHDLTREEISFPSTRAKVDWYDHYIYLTLHFPVPGGLTTEIDFILGQDFLITTHYEPVQALSEFSQILEGGNSSRKEDSFHAGHLFYYMIRELYNPIEVELDGLNRSLKQIEEKVFAGREAKVIHELSQISRQLLDIQWALKFHREALVSLSAVGKDFYGEKFGYYLGAVIGEYERIFELLKTNREIFAELRDTNESLLAIKNNQSLRLLTIILCVFTFISIIIFIFK